MNPFRLGCKLKSVSGDYRRVILTFTSQTAAHECLRLRLLSSSLQYPTVSPLLVSRVMLE